MEFWRNVEAASGIGSAYAWSLAGGIILALVLAALRPSARSRLRIAVLLLLLSLCVLLAGTGLLPQAAGNLFDAARFVAELCFALAWIELASALLFKLLLPSAGINTPPILFDALAGFVYVATVLLLLAINGVNLSGIVATSAVLTGIIGFSMQDTLGNLVGGISLQGERTIAVGDWIRFGEIEGAVRQTRWRQTSIETRDSSIVVIPNTLLTKSVITLLGHRNGTDRVLRARVAFEVDTRHSPEAVIDVVLRAILSSEIPDVIPTPPPLCLLAGFEHGAAMYKLYFWTTNIAGLPLVTSEMRRRVAVALRRSDIDLSTAQQHVLLTSRRHAAEAGLEQKELERRVAAIRSVELFAVLTDEEEKDLARLLRVAFFRDGENMSKQGEEADYLYVLTSGQAIVSVVSATGASSRVATLDAGDVFGEMGLMTGQLRTATVRATNDVTCYRLDKESFRSILQRRPELAEAMASLLMRRKEALDDVVRGLHQSSPGTASSSPQGELLTRIRKFFLLA